MSFETFISDASSEIGKVLFPSMSKLDELLKSSDKKRIYLANEKIISATRDYLDGKLEKFSLEELKKFSQYLLDIKRENYLNIMKSTYYDEGYVYTATNIDLAICDYIVNYAEKKELESNKKVINKEEVLKNSKKPNRLKKFLSKFSKNDKEMGE